MQKTYAGIYNDNFGGMTPLGSIVKDAWVFGLIEPTETCEGWSIGEMQNLYDRVTANWQAVGYRVAALPPEQRQRHAEIQAAAIERAKTAGWDPSLEHEDD